MYGLDCPYYTKTFPTVRDLIDDIILTGMDPNYEVTLNGYGIGTEAIDFITF